MTGRAFRCPAQQPPFSWIVCRERPTCRGVAPINRAVESVRDPGAIGREARPIPPGFQTARRPVLSVARTDPSEGGTARRPRGSRAVGARGANEGARAPTSTHADRALGIDASERSDEDERRAAVHAPVLGGAGADGGGIDRDRREDDSRASRSRRASTTSGRRLGARAMSEMDDLLAGLASPQVKSRMSAVDDLEARLRAPSPRRARVSNRHAIPVVDAPPGAPATASASRPPPVPRRPPSRSARVADPHAPLPRPPSLRRFSSGRASPTARTRRACPTPSAKR